MATTSIYFSGSYHDFPGANPYQLMNQFGKNMDAMEKNVFFKENTVRICSKLLKTRKYWVWMTKLWGRGFFLQLFQ